MNTETLHEILALDSLIGFLTWFDRAYLQLAKLGKQGELEPSDRILFLGNWMERTGFTVPRTKYGQERMLYFQNKYDRWVLADQFLFHHPELAKAINDFKTSAL